MEVDKSFDNPRKDLNGIDIAKNKTSPADPKAKAFRIEARDIILQPFISNESALISQESKERDFLNAHLSTPSFIKTLTDLSDDVMTYQTMQEKKIFLKQQLCRINRRLPAQVYIPFVSKSMRNYAILNIAVEEAKIFQTKERAPLLLCIEIYRPIEMSIDTPTELEQRDDL
tara:strand:- start:867 stop:1382 length:516 start_codon:yes stop_codon:yes gene_type:complete